MVEEIGGPIAAAENQTEIETRRREELREQYRSAQNLTREDGRTDTMAALLRDDEIYRSKVEGMQATNDALLALDAYVRDTVYDESAPIKDIEAVLEQFLIIAEEAKKNRPNARRIDEVLSAFLQGRLKDFESTLETRRKLAGLKTDSGNSHLYASQALKKDYVGDFKARSLAETGDEIRQKTYDDLGDYADPFKRININ